MSVTQLMTAEEFLAIPMTDGRRQQNLVDGEVVVTQPSHVHADVFKRILFALELWIRAAAGRGEVTAPIDVLLDDRNVFEPDVSWYSRERVPEMRAPRPYHLPDLAVEIRSPSTWRYDIGAKKDRYEQHGLAELWLCDTAADTVVVFRRSKPGAPSFDVALELARGDSLGSPLLPGFALAVDEVFPPR